MAFPFLVVPLESRFVVVTGVVKAVWLYLQVSKKKKKKKKRKTILVPFHPQLAPRPISPRLTHSPSLPSLRLSHLPLLSLHSLSPRPLIPSVCDTSDRRMVARCEWWSPAAEHRTHRGPRGQSELHRRSVRGEKEGMKGGVRESDRRGRKVGGRRKRI